MLAGGAVTHFAFDVSMHTGRPLGVSHGVTRLAVCRPPELWCAGRYLDYGIASISAELVIGGVEDVVSSNDRQDRDCGEYQ
jgi:hypothetical protein